MRTKIHNSKIISSLTIIYTLLWTLIIPIQAKPVPNNSVFNQNSSKQKQNDNPKLNKSYGNAPVYFEKNNGQFHEKVRFKAKGPDYTLFLTKSEAVYVFRDSSKSGVQSQRLINKP